MQNIKFKSQNQAEDMVFKKAINEVVNEYFQQNNLSRYANNEMRFKIFLFLSLWLLSYMTFYLFHLPPGLLFLTVVFHLFTHLLLVSGIGHDANHNSLFPDNKHNKIFSYALELSGLSSIIWKIQHNKKHHAYVNVLGEDGGINGGKIFRFSAKDKWLRVHKYQYMYCLFLYSLSILNFILTKDFKILKFYRSGDYHVSIWDIIWLFTFKMLYFVFYLFLPIYFGHYVAKQFICFYIIGQLIMGLIAALIFQLGHHFENTNFPDVTDNNINESWQIHIIKSSCDFATETSAINWLFGGANHHVVHHLFSNVCHVHYPALSKNLKKKVRSLGYKYNEFPRFREAYLSHIHELRSLGNREK